jgi:cytochrome b561
MKNTSNPRYHVLSILLHWLMVVLLIAVYSSMTLHGLYEKGTAMRNGLKQAHFMLGLLVFALVWVRIGMRMLFPAPPIQPEPASWMHLAAKLGHLALYGLMIAMPIAGWLILSGEGKAIPFFGLELPALIEPNKALAKNIEEVHETIGELGYFLIGIHAVAALFHHYFLKDNTLRRMLPWGR